jgi:hypothetical protein
MSDAEFIGGKAGPEDNAEWLRWAAETYASAVEKGGCYAPEPDWDVDSIPPGLLKAAAEIERLRALLDTADEIARQRAERRERIATACLVELVAWRGAAGSSDELSDAAINYADALIARLDKEAKP